MKRCPSKLAFEGKSEVKTCTSHAQQMVPVFQLGQSDRLIHGFKPMSPNFGSVLTGPHFFYPVFPNAPSRHRHRHGSARIPWWRLWPTSCCAPPPRPSVVSWSQGASRAARRWAISATNRRRPLLGAGGEHMWWNKKVGQNDGKREMEPICKLWDLKLRVKNTQFFQWTAMNCL